MPAIETIKFPSDIDNLNPDLYANDGYRHYPLIDGAIRRDLLLQRIRDIQARPTHAAFHQIREQDGDIEALILAERFDWGERHFGLGMAHIEAFRVSPALGPERAQIMRQEMYQALLAWAGRHDIQHLACRVPEEDIGCTDFLQSHGFLLADSIDTFLFDKRHNRWPASVRVLFTIRDYRDSDRDTILGLSKRSFQGSRFYQDPTFPEPACDTFYGEWAEKLCDGEMADDLFVAENSTGEVVGFLGYKLNRPLYKVAGIKLMGGGLGAIDPSAPGAYPALLHHAFEKGRDRYDMAELECRAGNERVMRIWKRFGCQKVRSAHTFHLKLG